MPFSPRMSWPFPGDGQEPWFERFREMVEKMDASAFASREDRHLVLMRGGNVSFVASTGVLAWSQDIEILAAITGFTWNVTAGAVTLQDGDLLYVDLVRSPTRTTTVTPRITRQIPSTDGALFLAVRRGSEVLWRDGYVINDGDSIPLYNRPSGAGGGNTLQEAYDEGGPGAGRIILANSGAVEINGVGLILDVNGNVDISGKLTVGGLIDPTGMEFVAQAVNPSGVGPTRTIWINSATGHLMRGAVDLETLSAGGTLDQAYDFGGAGAGRIIIADSGAVEIQSTGGLVVTSEVRLISGPLVMPAIAVIGKAGSGVTAFHVGEGAGTLPVVQADGNATVLGVGPHGTPGTDSVNIGEGAQSAGVGSVAVGPFTTVDFTATAGIAIGFSADVFAGAVDGHAIGNQAQALHRQTFVNGRTAKSTADKQVVFGGPGANGEYTALYLGRGVDQGAATGGLPSANFKIQATSVFHLSGNPSDANLAAKGLTFAGGQGTGTGLGGNLDFQVALPGAPGNARNALSTRLSVSGTNGDVSVLGKLNVTGLIDPTGLQFDRQVGNPGNADTLWVSDGTLGNPGDLFFGATNVSTGLGGGTGNTLDQAYDQGGPGAGRVITADAGAVEIAGTSGFLVSGGQAKLNDNISLLLGTGSDLQALHDGTNTVITSTTGNLIIDNTNATGLTIIRLGSDDVNTVFQVRNNSDTVQFAVDGAPLSGVKIGTFITEFTTSNPSAILRSQARTTNDAFGMDLAIAAGQSGPASAFTGRPGGDLLLRGGVGGAGILTQAAGPGGGVSLFGADAGVDGGGGGADGGEVQIFGGLSSGAGLPGGISIGTSRDEFVQIGSTTGGGVNSQVRVNGYFELFGPYTEWNGGVAPALSAANRGRLYFDSAADKLKASYNGSEFADLIRAAYGEMTVTTPTTTTVTTAGTPVAAADTTSLGNFLSFDSPVNGRLRYIGAQTRKFAVSVSSSVKRVSGSDPQVAQVILAKNGTELRTTESLVSLVELNSTRGSTGYLTTIQELAQNDYLQVFMDAAANGDQLQQTWGNMTARAVD